MEILTVSYSYPILIISILIAVCACFTTLDLVERAYTSDNNNKLWLLSGSVVLGLGIWSMHFTGMLAFETSVHVEYDALTTIFSMAIVIVTSLISFYLIGLEKTKNRMLIISTIIMGLGIASMHYVGMHGMKINAQIEHNYFISAISVLIAISVAFISLFVLSHVKRKTFSLYHFPLALLMGLGVSGFHYTAMESMTLYKGADHSAHAHSTDSGFAFNSTMMLFIIVMATFIIVGILHTLLIIDKKRSTSKVNYLAYHDNLTGLANRYMLTSRLQKILESNNSKELAVIFLDLDRFKFVNDTLGHGYGDNLLLQVSQRLVDSVRKMDLVARQGGDEFIILLENLTRPQVEEMAERISSCFSKPFLLKEEEFFISSSIGISTYPHDGVNVDELIKNADKAMYAVKKHGKNNYQFYIHEEKEMSDRKLIIEHGLKRAIEKQEFELYYQPKIELETGNIYGVEALIRWNHPELGLVPPLDFIPIAEETGMILPIGNWVLQEACKQTKQWQESGAWIQMAVNVSGLQFEDNLFVEKVRRALSEQQLSPEYLELEITESVMQNIDRSSIIIEELKSIGVKISIDDFGTGYSSLSLLTSLPIDIVKIDKSFINDMMLSPNASVLVKTIIEMGKNLNFDLIAEGIETQEQRNSLIEKGCLYGQGYFYSKPVQRNEIEILLANSSLITT